MSNLYIVATPIGNLQDITLRAARTLLASEIIVAESASKAGLLLAYLEREFNIKRHTTQKMISLTEDEEENKIPTIIKSLEHTDVSLISEAGTPLVSDPGFKLVREAVKRGIKVIPIPGASSPIAAISSSGLPTDKFLFLGFLPKSDGKKKAELERLKTKIIDKQFSPTIIFFESPARIVETLNTLLEVFGDIPLVIAREITKMHEEIVTRKISELLALYNQKVPKGEITVLFSTKLNN